MLRTLRLAVYFMKQAKLFYICRPKQWKTISSANLKDKGFPVYGANGIIGYHDEYNHEKPTILITCRGATCGTINVSLPFSYINGNAMALDDLKENEVNINYLAYYLNFRKLNDVITGTAQPQITRESLQNVKIPLPPLSTQQHIAQILDRADELRQKRKQVIAKLDELLQATFIKMFGDPVVNPMGWDKKPLKNLTGKILKLKNQSDYLGLKYIDLGSIDKDKKCIDYANLSVLSHDNFPSRARQIAKNFDILLSMVRPNLNGVAMINSNDNEFITSTGFSVLRCHDELNPYYLFECVKNKNFTQILVEQAVGASYPAVNETIIRDVEIALPPLSLQHQFAQIAKQIQTQKSTLQAQADELETLFLSLEQRAFGGALVGS